MAEIVKTVTPSLVTINPVDGASKTNFPLLAGEAIAAGDACYIKSDGKVWLSTGAAATAPAKVDGFAIKATPAGQPISLHYNVEFTYGPANLTPGKRLFLSGTVPGGLADAASTGGTAPVGHAVCNKTASSIVFLTKSGY